MKHIIYIMTCLLFFACTKNEKNVDATDEVTLDAQHEEVSNDEMEEAAAADETNIETNNSAHKSNVFVKQQLQETLNLIALKNNLDLTDDLNENIIESIQHKVKKYTLNKSIDNVEVVRFEIFNREEIGNQQIVEFIFEILTQQSSHLKGKGSARLTINSVNIDGEDYTDYQIYFNEIIVE